MIFDRVPLLLPIYVIPHLQLDPSRIIRGIKLPMEHRRVYLIEILYIFFLFKPSSSENISFNKSNFDPQALKRHACKE